MKGGKSGLGEGRRRLSVLDSPAPRFAFHSLPLAPTPASPPALSLHPFLSEMTSPDSYGFRAFLPITYAQ